MSSQLLTDEQKKELCSILETGDALQVQQLVQIGFPDIDAYEILRKRVEKRQDDPEIWGRVGYKEERRKQRWLHNFQRCSACGTLVLTSSHEPFICGHLYCPRKDFSCCPICGPVFDPLWEFLVLGGPQFSKVEWPSMPDNLSDETELRIFSSTVVQAHKLALQKIPIEALVSFALNGSPTGITSFLESHNDLATVVEESKRDVAKMWAWDRASRENHCFELLKQAIQIGLEGKREQWDVSNPVENFLYTKTLSPIREIFKQYSPSEFLKYLPLLSRRLIRDGVLDADFSIYDEITKFSSQRADESVVKVWLRRSREIYERCIQLPDRNVCWNGEEYFQHCKTVLHHDVVDILSVYPHLRLAFKDLAEALYSHSDFLSYGIIITGIEQVFGLVATKWEMKLTGTAAGPKQSMIPFEIQSLKLARG